MDKIKQALAATGELIAILKKNDLSLDYAAIIHHLGTQTDGGTYTTIAVATGMNAFTIRRYIADLISKGLLQTTRRKEVVMTLTDAGREMLESMLALFMGHADPA